MALIFRRVKDSTKFKLTRRNVQVGLWDLVTLPFELVGYLGESILEEVIPGYEERKRREMKREHRERLSRTEAGRRQLAAEDYVDFEERVEREREFRRGW